MMTSSHGNIFRVTDPFWGSLQRPVARSFDILFDLPLDKQANYKRIVLGFKVQRTIETPVIWDAIALIMTSL